MLELTENNYYTPQADMEYCSVSQIKKFMECPAEAMAELKGEWSPESESRALLVSSYMDALWDGKEAVDRMMLEYRPQIYTKTGKKRADIEDADKAFMRAQRDRGFCKLMAGEHQTIMTAEIVPGIPFKIKMDSYFPATISGDGEVIDPGKIVDEKYMKDLQPGWIEGHQRVPWLDVYNYPMQLAAYREVVRLNTGVEPPCYICAITKEKPEPDMQVILLNDWKLKSELEVIKYWCTVVQEYKTGKKEPPRCGRCDYCRATKSIDINKPMSYEELLKEI